MNVIDVVLSSARAGVRCFFDDLVHFDAHLCTALVDVEYGTPKCNPNCLLSSQQPLGILTRNFADSFVNHTRIAMVK